MKQFKKIWRIWSYVALLLSVITLIYFRLQEPPCSEYYENAKKIIIFNGIVNDKIIDKKRHNYKTIILSVKYTLQKIILDSDKSGFYDYIKKGDSIIKESGSFEMKVFRNSEIDTTFILDYGCKK